MKRKHIFIALPTAGFIAILLLGVSLFVGIPVAIAATDQEVTESITLSPVSTRFGIDAGSSKKNELTIVNDGETAYDFIVYARPYSVVGEEYDPDFDPDTAIITNADAYQWVQFEQTNWNIKPGETLKIPYTIRVPQGAAPGGHYGVIFAETQPKETTGTSVARKKRVGSIIYATVNGTYTTGGQVLDTHIAPVQFRAPLVSDTTIENTGNADFEVESTYRVSDLFGDVKYEGKNKHIVLPRTTRKITLEWANAPWFGLYNVAVETSFFDQSSKTSSLVLLVPRWLLLTLGVAIVGGGVYAMLHNRRR